MRKKVAHRATVPPEVRCVIGSNQGQIFFFQMTIEDPVADYERVHGVAPTAAQMEDLLQGNNTRLNYWDLPSGKVLHGEKPEEAVQRVMNNRLRIDLERCVNLSRESLTRGCFDGRNSHHYFLALEWSGEMRVNPSLDGMGLEAPKDADEESRKRARILAKRRPCQWIVGEHISCYAIPTPTIQALEAARLWYQAYKSDRGRRKILRAAE